MDDGETASEPAEGRRLAPLDLVELGFTLLDTKKRTLDFTAVFRIDLARWPFDLLVGGLQRGLAFVADRLPRLQRIIRGKHWVTTASLLPELTSVDADEDAVRRSLSIFLDEPLPHDEPLMRQLLTHVKGSTEAHLWVRVHHSLMDPIGLLLVLGSQWAAAAEHPAPPLPTERVRLDRHDAPARRMPFAPRGRPEAVAVPRGRKPVSRRAWTNVELDAAPLKRAARAMEVTYNDLLAAACLLALRDHNERVRGRCGPLGLAVMVNIRRRPFEGIGNGVSRVRVYHEGGGPGDLPTVARSVASQRAMALARGEWSVPYESRITRLPLWMLRAIAWVPRTFPHLFRTFTTVFTHMQRLPPPAGPDPMAAVSSMYGIPPMSLWNPLSVAGASFGDRTVVTLAYNPGLLTSDEVSSLADRYRAHLLTALTGG